MPDERKITISGKPAIVKGTNVYKNGNYVGQLGGPDLKEDKNNLKPSKAALAEDAKKKAVTTKKGPIYKTDARIARDYAANAVYDAKHGKKSEAKFEKKKLMHIVNTIAGPRSRG